MAEREGAPEHFKGDGTFIAVRPGKHMWETNFIPDAMDLTLHGWAERGGGSSSVQLILADSILHAHISEMPVGTYKKAHRHGPDVHVFCLSGEGYSLFWYEGDRDFVRIDWRHGYRHFGDLLADGDVACNAGNWQWVAGTRNNTLPNRVMNPLRQAQRFDRDGEYVRRYVPELAGLDAAHIRAPWQLPARERPGYPGPIVELS